MARFSGLVGRVLGRAVRIFGNLLPDRVTLLLKSNLRMIRKMDYRRHDVYLNIDTEVEYDIRLHSCEKEPETVAWIEEFLRKGDIMYDVGANVGAYALVATKFTEGQAKIYAFEPSFPTFTNLSRNILLNACSGSVIPLYMALSDNSGLETFQYLDLAAGSSCHALEAKGTFTGDTLHSVCEQAIITYTIDDLVRGLGIEVPNLIKLDVDGAELAILQGAEETLHNRQLRSVLVEVNESLQEPAEAIVDCLASAGFELQSKHKFEYGKESESGPFAESYNYIFVRNKTR